MALALGLVAMYGIGVLSGVYLGAVPIDNHASHTDFIVAHIHYVLFGGSLFTIFAGIYYWFPKMTGRMYNERLGKLHFWLTFVGFNATFFPMHYLGIQGMPRRVSDYAPRFADLNFFISIASFFLGASTLVFLYNMIVSWARGEPAPANPWRALTIEWQVSSPPRAAAGRRLERTLAALREAGIPAHGLVVDTSPVDTVKDALAQLDPKPDKIVVSTHPEEKSGWLRKHVIEQIRDAAGTIPVEHV